MDLFSHVLFGFIFGQALQLDTNAQVILIISSVVLDVDAISIPGWEKWFHFHRGRVHSILGAILVSLLIGTVYTIVTRVPARSFISIVLICLGGSFTHIFLDLLTTGSIAVLWPFSSKKVAFGFTHYVDPIVLGVLLLASALIVYLKNDVRMIQIVTIVVIVLLTLNFGVRYHERDAATETARALVC